MTMTWLRWHTVYTHWHRRTWELARDEQQRLRLWYICGWPTVSETQTNAFECFTVPHIYIYTLFSVHICFATFSCLHKASDYVSLNFGQSVRCDSEGCERDGRFSYYYVHQIRSNYILSRWRDAGVDCIHFTYNIHRYCYYFYISATNKILNIIHKHIQFGLFAQHDPFKLCVSYGNR